MHTLAPTSTFSHTTLRFDSQQPTQFIDITNDVKALVLEAGIRVGLVNVQSRHTTTAIIVNEHEPLLLSDLDALLERAAPVAGPYRHDDLSIRTVNLVSDERANGHAHCRASMLGTSVALNVARGELQLGRWQRLFLVDLDGPRAREVSVLLWGESGR
jgi:secondary thiamine-phosphate synthase enzyme